jgi:hypothetical protein
LPVAQVLAISTGAFVARQKEKNNRYQLLRELEPPVFPGRVFQTTVAGGDVVGEAPRGAHP